MREYIPYPYQEYCYNRILDTPNIALWLDMGLGKTVITLSAIDTLIYDKAEVSKVLVIAPKKVAEATWQNEAQSWNHLTHLRFSTVLGTVKQRQAALKADADIYVTSRDLVNWLVGAVSKWPFDCVVIDEASSFKDSRTVRFKALKGVLSHINRLIELTGTPAPQSMLDIWSQLYLLDRGERLERFVSRYRAKYFDPDKRNAMQVFTWKLKPGAFEEITAKVSDICISMKSKDYIELPDMIEDIVPVKLSDANLKAYKAFEKAAVMDVDSTEITALNAAALMNKLLQCANGAVYDEAHDVHEVHTEKIDALIELLERLQGEHALLFYSFQHDRDRIMSALAKTNLRMRLYTNSEDADAWNAGKVDVLIAHPASCAYGLNLQHGGHHIIWYGLTWSLEQYQQANKRLHRNGQDKPVFVHILSCIDTADADIIRALERKDGSQESLLLALKARIDRSKES